MKNYFYNSDISENEIIEVNILKLLKKILFAYEWIILKIFNFIINFI